MIDNWPEASVYISVVVCTFLSCLFAYYVPARKRKIESDEYEALMDISQSILSLIVEAKREIGHLPDTSHHHLAQTEFMRALSKENTEKILKAIEQVDKYMKADHLETDTKIGNTFARMIREFENSREAIGSVFEHVYKAPKKKLIKKKKRK